jgi:hypothetical protein
MGFCQGPLCVEVTYRSDYCGDCQKLRNQHGTSHRVEGHTRERIVMCPACEAITAQNEIIGLE